MRYALISDIHANLPAFEAVLADIAARPDVNATYHLGDLVGYSPWPNETVERLRAAGIAGVSGNYDTTVASHAKHCGCRSEDAKQEELAHRSFEWTLEHTSAESKAFLGGLPFRLDLRPLSGHASGPTVTLLHGNHVLNTVYVTADRTDDFLQKMGSAIGSKAGDIVAFGHTHKPWHRIVDGVHFVNTGSVGRPKDFDWRAGYVLLGVTADAVDVAFVRIEYDVETAARGVIDAGLPVEFAAFLRTGGRASSTDSAAPGDAR